jgi:hypothetical protein
MSSHCQAVAVDDAGAHGTAGRTEHANEEVPVKKRVAVDDRTILRWRQFHEDIDAASSFSREMLEQF